MEKKKTINSQEDRRFAIFSGSSVSMIGEAEGYADLSPAVSSVVAEDITYRLRELIRNATQYMKNSRRKRLTVEDINKALKTADVQPVYGHGAPEGQPWRQAKEGELFLLEDMDMALPNIACNNLVPTLTGSTTVKANWLVLEGNQKNSSLVQSSHGKLNGKTGKIISEDLLQYHHNITRALLGSDQELMKLAITDLRTNPNLAPLLPFLLDFVSNWIKNMNPDVDKFMRLLYTIHAVVNNSNLFLEPRPYLSLLTECVLHCMIEPLENNRGQHWTVRDYAARLLAVICRQWDSPVNRLYDNTLKLLSEVLYDATRSFSTHYGVVRALSYFGVQALKDVLVPIFPKYWEHLTSTMNDDTLLKERLDAGTVYGALRDAAALLIKHHKDEFSIPNNKKQLGSSNMADPLKIKTDESNSFSAESGASESKFSPVKSNDSIKHLYMQFIECFGDSVLAGIPVHFDNSFKKPFTKEVVVSLADADSHRTGEDLLKEFLKASPPQYKRFVSIDRKSEGRISSDVASSDISVSGDSKSERSSRSERSHSDECFSDDTDLTVKATVNDPSKGIKLFISKRPKNVGKAKPETKRKRTESLNLKLHNIFDVQVLRKPKKEVQFGFSTKDWKTSLKKQQMDLMHRKRKMSYPMQLSKQPKSEYLKLCSSLPVLGRKRTKKSSESKNSSTQGNSGFDISCIL